MGIGLSRLYLVPELKDPECDISDSLKHFEKKNHIWQIGYLLTTSSLIKGSSKSGEGCKVLMLEKLPS